MAEALFFVCLFRGGREDARGLRGFGCTAFQQLHVIAVPACGHGQCLLAFALHTRNSVHEEALTERVQDWKLLKK